MKHLQQVWKTSWVCPRKCWGVEMKAGCDGFSLTHELKEKLEETSWRFVRRAICPVGLLQSDKRSGHREICGPLSLVDASFKHYTTTHRGHLLSTADDGDFHPKTPSHRTQSWLHLWVAMSNSPHAFIADGGHFHVAQDLQKIASNFWFGQLIGQNIFYILPSHLGLHWDENYF